MSHSCAFGTGSFLCNCVDFRGGECLNGGAVQTWRITDSRTWACASHA